MAVGTTEMGPDTMKVASWTVANRSKPRLSGAGPVHQTSQDHTDASRPLEQHLMPQFLA